MNIDSKYAVSVALFAELAQRTVQSYKRLHVVRCAHPAFGLLTSISYPGFKENLLKGIVPMASETPELFAAPLVEGAVILGAIGLRMEIHLREMEWYRTCATSDCLTSLVPTFRMVMAGPTRDCLASKLRKKGFEDIAVDPIGSAEAGIKFILATDREVRLTIDNPDLTSIGDQMKVVQAWYRHRPKFWSFLYWPNGRLSIGCGGLIPHGGLFETAWRLLQLEAADFGDERSSEQEVVWMDF